MPYLVSFLSAPYSYRSLHLEVGDMSMWVAWLVGSRAVTPASCPADSFIKTRWGPQLSLEFQCFGLWLTGYHCELLLRQSQQWMLLANIWRPRDVETWDSSHIRGTGQSLWNEGQRLDILSRKHAVPLVACVVHFFCSFSVFLQLHGVTRFCFPKCGLQPRVLVLSLFTMSAAKSSAGDRSGPTGIKSAFWRCQYFFWS